MDAYDALDIAVAAAVDAVQEAPSRADVVKFRSATVVGVAAGGGCDLLLDGTARPVKASIVDSHAWFPGDRALVCFVPPSGIYVVGKAGGEPDRRWHVIGDPNEVPFAAGWGPYPAAGYPAQGDTSPRPMYCRVGWFCSLRGSWRRTSGTGALMTTLPAGYRPENMIQFPALVRDNDAAAQYVNHATTVEVHTDGSVVYGDKYGAVDNYVLVEHSYLVAPPPNTSWAPPDDVEAIGPQAP